MRKLAERLLRQIREKELMGPGDRVGCAVSGGIDSVALLRLLIEVRHELGVVLSVIHFNHRLRGLESDGDQEFVASLAREHGLEFYVDGGDVAQHAADEHSGLEAASRELRYEYFGGLLGAQDNSEDVSPFGAEPDPFSKSRFNKIVTGHTLDDQAETVLMRLIRGTGLRGLAGIFPRMVMEDEDGEAGGEIVRPLLGISRCELEQYLRDINQSWREDSTNADAKFTRNRLRKFVLPLLEREFNPAVAEGLSELAEIAREEEDYWDGEVSGWLGTVVQWLQPEWMRGLPGFADSSPLVQIEACQPQPQDPALLARLQEPGAVLVNASLSRPWLLTEPRAVQRRVLKAVGEQLGISLEFKHVEEILRFGENGLVGKELSLPLGWKIVRESEAVVFVAPDLRHQERIPDYEYLLPLPGQIVIPELKRVIEVFRIDPGTELAEYNPQQLLRADLLRERLTVRNWRPGDRFWPAHTKAAKKVKELLQEKHIHQSVRRLWPVVMNGEEIIWMRGFPVPAKLRAGTQHSAILIRETPLEEDTRRF